MAIDKRPPRAAEWLLSRSLSPVDRDTLLGDFSEFYTEIAAASGPLSAIGWYWRQALRSLPRLLSHTVTWSAIMIRKHLLLSLRHLRRQKIHSLINIGGLAMGIACCLLIFGFVRHEWSFDRFHEHADEIFSLNGTLIFGNAQMLTSADPPLGPTLPGLFPEVVSSVRITKEHLIFRRGRALSREQGIAAGPSFFDIFSFPLVESEAGPVLEDPQAILLSRRLAEKMFGDCNPVGQTLAVRLGDEFEDFRVGGIFRDPPDNSSLRFDYILNLRKVHGSLLEQWDSGRHLPTFLRLAAPRSAVSLQAKFPESIDARLQEAFGERSGYHLQALLDYHLKGGRSSSLLEGKSRAAYSYILIGIGLLVLLVACFNYTNLAIAGATSRLKEIGVRKVLGAMRRQLLRQFWFESLVTSLTAIAVGFLLALVFLPAFNRMVGKSLMLDPSGDGGLWLALAGLAVFVGIAAGSYPALVMSGFHPVALFHGRIRFSGRNLFSRALIVFQFGISIFLIIATVFVSRQYRFLLSENPGFDSDQVVVISLEEVSSEVQRSRALFPVFKRKLASITGVRSLSGAEFALTRFWASKAPEVEKDRRELVDFTGVDRDYIETLGIPLLAGRNFSADYPTDLKEAVIVNRAFVRRFEMDSPVGRRLSEPFLQDFPGTIIGVMDDFHYRSFHQPIRPAYIHLQPEQEFQYLYVKLAGGDLRGALARVEAAFQDLVPEVPFNYSFLDEEIARQYRNEARWEKMVNAAGVFAILIACSGLFGLTMLTAWRRTKEIGIRKVMGASTGNIVGLINREFIGLVVAANLLAWPAAYFAVRALFQNYAYRVPLSVWGFLLAALLAALIALLTVSAYAVRVGWADPVEAIRYE